MRLPYEYLEPSRWYAYPLIFLQILNLGILRPSIPTLLLGFFSGSFSQVSLYSGIADGIGAVVAFTSFPAVGKISDTHGRRPVFLATTISTMLPIAALAAYAVVKKAAKNSANPDGETGAIVLYGYLFLSIIAKIHSLPTTLAYVADCTAALNAKNKKIHAEANVLPPASSASPQPSPSPAQSPDTVKTHTASHMTRTRAFGEVAAVSFFALSIGPMIASVFSMYNSFILAFILSLAHVLYAYIVIPETVHKDGNPQHQHIHKHSKQHRHGEENDNELLQPLVHAQGNSKSNSSSSTYLSTSDSKQNHLTASAASSSSSTSSSGSSESSAKYLNPLVTLSFMVSRPVYALILGIVMLEQTAVFGVGEVYLLYLMDVLGFTRGDNIQVLTLAAIFTLLVMLFLLPFLTGESVALSEAKVITLSICAYATYCILLCAVTDKWQVYFIAIFYSLSAMAYPATGALLSLHATDSEGGLAQGALTAIRSLAAGIGPLIFSAVFSFFSLGDQATHAQSHDASDAMPPTENPDAAATGTITDSAVLWSFGSFNLRSICAPFILGAILSLTALTLSTKLPNESEMAHHRRTEAQKSRQHDSENGSV